MGLARYKVSLARCLSLPASKTFEVDLGIKHRICSLGRHLLGLCHVLFMERREKRVHGFSSSHQAGRFLGVSFLLVQEAVSFSFCFCPLRIFGDVHRSFVKQKTAFSRPLNRLPLKVCYFWPSSAIPHITYCPTRERHEGSIFEEGRFTDLFCLVTPFLQIYYPASSLLIL